MYILSFLTTILDIIFCEYKLKKLIFSIFDLIFSDLIIMRYIVWFLRYFLSMLKDDMFVRLP